MCAAELCDGHSRSCRCYACSAEQRLKYFRGEGELPRMAHFKDSQKLLDLVGNGTVPLAVRVSS